MFMSTKETAPKHDGVSLADYPGSPAEYGDGPVSWYLNHPEHLLPETRSAARQAFMQSFGQRCKRARGNKEILDVSQRLGVHRNTIWNIERGDTLPDAFVLELLAKEYGTTTTQLLDDKDEGAPAALSNVAKSVTAVEVDGFVHVPLFDVQVSAGNGAFNDVESIEAMKPFDANFIRRDLGIAHNHIAMSRVAGVSMEPWLHHKDTILSDLRDREALTEGVHVVRLDGALLVKKLQRLPGKILRVSSYNAAYEPFDVQGGEDSDRDFAVIGRVRWGGVIFN